MPWRFLIFTAAFGLLLYAQFYFAHRQWKRLKGERSADIDLGYIRMEDCLARSFRQKVEDWLRLPGTADGAGRLILKGRERVRAAPALSFPAREECDDVLVAEGDFTCENDCHFNREIYARGNVRVGSGTQLQALTADQDVTLEEKVSVVRWVDSTGDMELKAGCRIGARVTSRKAVRLGMGAQAASVFAPQVTTDGFSGVAAPAQSPDGDLPEILPPESAPDQSEALARLGLQQKRMAQLSSDCWLYRGRFEPSGPLRIKTRLVVKGDCRLPGGSVLAGDLRAGRSLFIGPASVCAGNLVAGKDVCLGRNCRFSGIIHAGGSLLLSAGTRGQGEQRMVAAYSAKELAVERDVVLGGKLASGERVVVVRPAAAERWRKSRGVMEA